jgi:hypothetical protein
MVVLAPWHKLEGKSNYLFTNAEEEGVKKDQIDKRFFKLPLKLV